MKIDDTLTLGEWLSTTKGELLNHQFSSVFTVDHPGSDSNLSGPSYPPLEHLRITGRGVEKLLLAINPSKAAGPDQIPCRILKELASELAPMVTAIYNQSLQTCQLPAV